MIRILPYPWRRVSPPPAPEEQRERGPAAPFPLAEEWQWEYDFDPGEHVSLMRSLYRDGSPVLGAEKPGSYWALITAGTQRGDIWLLADGCAFPYVGPDRDSGRSLGFLEWVEQWLAPGAP